jgi:hypothetical protein
VKIQGLDGAFMGLEISKYVEYLTVTTLHQE